MFLFIIGIITFSVVASIIARSMDRDRIRKYISQQGGKVISIRSSPFGPGWFWEENSRFYKVSYFDEKDAEHEADCKTSMYSGVYFTNDTTYTPILSRKQIQEKQVSSRETELEHENKRLREELERIKKGGL